jgi:hypothetical protein
MADLLALNHKARKYHAQALTSKSLLALWQFQSRQRTQQGFNKMRLFGAFWRRWRLQLARKTILR